MVRHPCLTQLLPHRLIRLCLQAFQSRTFKPILPLPNVNRFRSNQYFIMRNFNYYTFVMIFVCPLFWRTFMQDFFSNLFFDLLCHLPVTEKDDYVFVAIRVMNILYGDGHTTLFWTLSTKKHHLGKLLRQQNYTNTEIINNVTFVTSKS